MASHYYISPLLNRLLSSTTTRPLPHLRAVSIERHRPGCPLNTAGQHGLDRVRRVFLEENRICAFEAVICPLQTAPHKTSALILEHVRIRRLILDEGREHDDFRVGWKAGI